MIKEHNHNKHFTSIQKTQFPTLQYYDDKCNKNVS